MNNFKYIVVHHSATSDGTTVDWSAIRNYHINNNKWSDIGYNFGIEKVNNTYEILYGRSLLMPGAHTYGLNRISIGICVVGNFDNEKPNDQQINKLIFLLKDLMILFNIPISNVIGHRETYILYKNGVLTYDTYKENIKSCPGFNFSMKMIRNILSKDENLKIGNEQLLKQLNDFDDEVIKRKEIFYIK